MKDLVVPKMLLSLQIAVFCEIAVKPLINDDPLRLIADWHINLYSEECLPSVAD